MTKRKRGKEEETLTTLKNQNKKLKREVTKLKRQNSILRKKLIENKYPKRLVTLYKAADEALKVAKERSIREGLNEYDAKLIKNRIIELMLFPTWGRNGVGTHPNKKRINVAWKAFTECAVEKALEIRRDLAGENENFQLEEADQIILSRVVTKYRLHNEEDDMRYVNITELFY